MEKSLIDLDIKFLDREDVPSYLDCKDLQKVYLLRYRYFLSSVEGHEYEYVFPSMSSCLLKLTQLLCNYYHLL